MTRFIRAALAAALALSCVHASAQTYRDTGGTIIPGVVPIGGDGSGPLFTLSNPGHVSGADPCFGSLKSIADVETTTGTGAQVVAGVTGKKIYICGLTLVNSAAANISLIEGSNTTCAASQASVYLNNPSSISAANGASFAANSGVARGDGSSALAATAAAGDALCVVFTTTNSPQVNVHVSYVQQ